MSKDRYYDLFSLTKETILVKYLRNTSTYYERIQNRKRLYGRNQSTG